MLDHVLLFILAIFAALAGAFSGGGTSFFVLSFLLLLWPSNAYIENLALAKSVAVAMTCAAAVVHYKKQPNLNWPLLGILILAGLLGTAIGTYVIESVIPEDLIKPILGILLLICGGVIGYKSQLGVDEHDSSNYSVRDLVITFLVVAVINIINGMYGGTGIFVVLFLVIFLRMSFIQAAAYCGIKYVLINILQSGYLIYSAKPDLSFIIIAITGGLVGATVGTHLQYLNGNKMVKTAALVLMLILGVRMLLFS